MNILIPIFPRNDEERELMWKKIGKKPLLSLPMERLGKLDNASLFVFTDQESVREYARHHNLPCQYVKADFSQDLSGMFAPGTWTSLKHLLKNQGIINEHFVVVDYRNPLLSAEIVLALRSP